MIRIISVEYVSNYSKFLQCILIFSFVGCDGREWTNGRDKNARWKIMEPSRSFPSDTCLSIFDQGWVRDHHSPVEAGTIKEKTLIKIPEDDSPLCNHLYMDPSSQRSRGWNFVSYREVLVVFWCTFIVLGDISFAWGEEGLLSWRMMLGQSTWL